MPRARARISSWCAPGKLYTTPVSAGILEGITRDSVMKIAEDNGMPVIEKRHHPVGARIVADEVFMTGTAAEVQPIHSIDEHIIGNGQAGTGHAQAAKAVRRRGPGQEPKYAHWVDYV